MVGETEQWACEVFLQLFCKPKGILKSLFKFFLKSECIIKTWFLPAMSLYSGKGNTHLSKYL